MQKKKTHKGNGSQFNCFKIVELMIDIIENLKLQKCICKNECQVWLLQRVNIYKIWKTHMDW